MIYDVLGKEVATLVNEIQKAGFSSVQWDVANSPSGIYFCRLTAGNFSDVKKMVLLKQQHVKQAKKHDPGQCKGRDRFVSSVEKNFLLDIYSGKLYI